MSRNGTDSAQLYSAIPLMSFIQPYWDVFSWLKAPSQATRVDATIFHHLAFLIVAAPFPIICYLARRPGTHIYRLVLALSAAPIMLLFMAAVRWAPPKELPINVFRSKLALLYPQLLQYSQLPKAMSGIQIAIRMLELGFSREGAKRIDEASIGTLRKSGKHESFQAAIGDTFDLAFTVRGLKYDFGRGLKLPRDTRPTSDRTAWMWQTLTLYAIPNYLVFDFINNCFIRSPDIYAIAMEQIDFRQLDWPDKTLIKFLLAIMVITSISCIYHVIALLFVAILGMAPDEWPVVFGRPWTAGSLHSFWAGAYYVHLLKYKSVQVTD